MNKLKRDIDKKFIESVSDLKPNMNMDNEEFLKTSKDRLKYL